MTIANAESLIYKFSLMKIQDPYDLAFDVEKQKKFEELKSQYSWDIVVDYECRRRVTQYGRYKEEFHSDENFFGRCEYEPKLFAQKDNGVQWIGSENFGKPKILKFKLQILNVRKKEEN